MQPLKVLAWALALALCLSSAHADGVVITSVEPNYGSVSGGTRVTIRGSGFSSDIYAGGNVIMFGDVPCKNVWFYSTTTSLVCITTPMNPRHATTPSPVPVTVIVDSTAKSECAGYCQFSFIENETPTISRITPSGGPAGTRVAIEGRFFTTTTDDLPLFERIYVGDDVCDMRDPATRAYYDTTFSYDSYRSTVQCVPAETEVGYYNALASMPARGDSYAELSAVKVSSNLKLYMYQVVPDITSVSPSHGSVEGGSTITIAGSGFGTSAAGLKVSVGGVPCEVEQATLSDTSLTCKIAGRFQSSATAFTGNRGARMELFFDIGGDRIVDLRAAPKFPNSPDASIVLTGEASGFVDKFDLYGTRIVAAFVPPVTDNYTFFLASDDNSEVRIGSKLDGSDAVAVATFDEWVLENHWFDYGARQRSTSPVPLVAGEPVYLELICKEGYGRDTCAVGALADHSPYSEKETGSAVQEKQLVAAIVNGNYDTQRITIAGGAHSNGTFVIELGGKQTVPLSARSTPQEIADALHGILGMGCVVTDGDDLYDLDDFEHGYFSSDLWTPRNGNGNPVIIPHPGVSYCGMASMTMPVPYAVDFEMDRGLEDGQTSQGFNTRSYPYICTAYRMSQGRANMLIREKARGWYSIPLTDTYGPNTTYTYPRIGAWFTDDSPTQIDDHWHYKCINVDEMLNAAFPEDPSHNIDSVVWYPPREDGSSWGQLWIDEFSISATPRDVKQTSRADVGPVAISGALVTKDIVGDDVSFVVRLASTECPVEYPVMKAISSDLGVAVERARNASHPIGGNFTLSFGSATTRPIAHDADGDDVADALFPLIGKSTVTLEPRGCDGRAWHITFDSLNGRQPMLVANASALTGTDARVIVDEMRLGGLFLAPIQADMLRTIHATPQVTVTRVLPDNSEFLAVCSAESGCGFEFRESDAAFVASVAPQSGGEGARITMTVQGLPVGAVPLVNVGGEPCRDVAVAAAGAVWCTVPRLSAGSNAVVVIVPGMGRAKSTATFVYSLSATSVSHAASSVEGGLMLTIAGDGFSPSIANNAVTVESVGECIVVESSYTTIKCLTPRSAAGEVSSRAVSVAVGGQTAVAGALSFLQSATRHVSSVSPTHGSVGGGTVLTLHGDFQANDVVTVKVGAFACDVRRTGAGFVECVTSHGAVGTHAVVAGIHGMGLSATAASFEYQLVVSTVSATAGSALGGQRITLTGAGFTAVNASLNPSVTVAGAPCEISDISYDSIACTTAPAARTVRVTNGGVHPKYGAGYAWSPARVEVEVGDTVEWSWTGSSLTGTLHSVEQVASQDALSYNGVGFRSERSGSGLFSVRFTAPGTYHYVSADFGEIGMRGVVVVRERSPAVGLVSVSIGSTSASFSGTFTRSASTTPLITSVVPFHCTAGDSVTISGLHFGDVGHAAVSIGGVACTSLSSAGSNAIRCVIGATPAGVHRVKLVFSDVGAADSAAFGGDVEVRPVVTSLDAHAGSLMGARTLRMTGTGFGSAGARVFVGASECIVQHSSSSEIECTTTASDAKGGYSAAVKADGAVFTRTFDESVGDDEDLVRLKGVVGVGGQFGSNTETVPVDAWTSAAIFGERSSGYSFEMWVQPAVNPTQYTLIASALGADAGSGAAFLINPSGRVEFWTGAGASESRRAEGHAWHAEVNVANLFAGDAQAFDELTSGQEHVVHERMVAGENVFTQGRPHPTAVPTPEAKVDATNAVVTPAPASVSPLPGRWAVTEGPAVEHDQWYHMVGVVSDGTQRFFVNGELVGSTPSTPVACAPQALVFGGLPAPIGSATKFSGVIDEVALYRGPTDTAVASHYSYGRTAAQPVFVVAHSRAAAINGVGFVAPYYEVVGARVGGVERTAEGSLVDVSVSSACAADSCAYTASSALTPTVDSVSPREGNGPSFAVTITGSGFSSVAAENAVDFEGVPCVVVSSDGSSLTCNAPAAKAGRRHVRVNVAGKGDANSTAQPLSFSLQASTVAPTSGSIAGGTLLTINGHGFSTVASENAVVVGGSKCAVVGDVTATTLQCETSAHSGPVADAMVIVTVGDASSLSPQRFSYADDATPRVNFVQPSSGRAGQQLAVFGSAFANDTASVKVTVGDVKCEVVTAAEDSITCTLGANIAGSHSVRVSVDGLGNALSSVHFTHSLLVDSVSTTQSGFGGGVALVIDGDGFDGRQGNSSANAINVCGAACIPTSASFGRVECVLSRHPGQAAPNADAQCSVVAHVNGAEASWSSKFTLRAAWTAIVTGHSPRRGGTMGGTVLTITGSNFHPSSGVTISGSECKISSVNATAIVCVTGSHATSRKAQIRVNAPEWGDAFATDATFDYVDRWSSCATWGKDCNKPVAGDIAYVKKGQTVLLDEATPVLDALVVEGSLVFDRVDGVELNAKYVLINGGYFEIGTEAEPFLQRATITLYGHTKDTELPVYGSKVLACRNCTLEIHGRPIEHTWTVLAETAHVNATSIRLREPVNDWHVGDRVVIAASFFDTTEAEVMTIASITDNNRTLTFTSRLAHEHLGETVTYGSRSAELRAEVGLLTRNVVFQGALDPSTPTGDTFGAQLFVHMHQGARIEYLEARHVGQAFRLGRYPLHFHMPGTSAGSYIRGCAIHKTFNRAVTMHGVHQLLVERNVAYDVLGHTYFLEDGIETGNMIRYNLGISTRGAASLLNTDQLPATFWITNARNHFIGNHAAGSDSAGFWFNTLEHPTGPSATDAVCPIYSPLGTFRDNVAHSNYEFGVRSWEKWISRVDECGKGAYATTQLVRTTAYANGKGIELAKVGHAQVLDSVVLDSYNVNVQLTAVEGTWGGPLVANCLIVGRSGLINVANYTGSHAGIVTPNSHYMTVENVTFVNFDGDKQSMLRGCAHCRDYDGGSETRFKGIAMINCPHVGAFQWEHELMWRDLDGSLTGARGWAVPRSNLYDPSACTDSPSFSSGLYPGMVCTDKVEFRKIGWNAVVPDSLLGHNATLTSRFGVSRVPWRLRRTTHPNGYMALVPGNDTVAIAYDVEAKDRVDVTDYLLNAYLLDQQDWIGVASDYLVKHDHFEINGKSLDLGRPVAAGDPNTAYFFDNATMRHTYVVAGNGSFTQEINFHAIKCPKTGCVLPPVNQTHVPKAVRSWCDADGWASGRVPEDGDDVTIESNEVVLLDCNTAKLHLLNIKGTLEFVDGGNRELTATYIIVRDGRLGIGNSTAPFRSRATISLTGSRTTPEMTATTRLPLGSKVLAVFGDVEMVGAPPNVTWTRLSATAVAGATSITLEKSVPWAVGDEIVIAPTGYSVFESETRVLAAVSPNGRILSFAQPLSFRHAATKATYGSRSVEYTAEVGVLSRNIVVRGIDNAAEFGGRVLVGSYANPDAGATPAVFTGRFRADGVEFRECGQRGWPSYLDPRYALVFKDVGNAGPSFVRRCSFNFNFNTAVGAHASDGLEISNNVAYRTVGDAYYVSSRLASVVGNLALRVEVAFNHLTEAGYNDESSGFNVRGPLSILRGNAAGGSERNGFRVRGDTCNVTAPDGRPYLDDNVAHSVSFGFKIDGVPACTTFGNFRVFKSWDYGVYALLESSLELHDFVVADAHKAVFLAVYGPNVIAHFALDKTTTVTNALVVGISEEGACSEPRPANMSVLSLGDDTLRVGIHMGAFNMDKVGGPPHMWDEVMSYPSLYGKFIAKGITLAGFGLDECGRRNYAVASNPLAPDGTHPHYFSGVEWVSVEDESKLYYYEPNPAWRTQFDCVDMDCDGPKHVITVDADGSFFGARGGTVIPIAELRFDETKIPPAALKGPGGKALTVADVAPKQGIVREGLSCEKVPAWKAYKCAGGTHRMFVIESLDADTETRRLSPISLTADGTMDLINGPQDHGWCENYTCLKRLSTFFATVAAGRNYTMYMTGTNPTRTRFHLPNAETDEAIVLAYWFTNPQRIDVYRDGRFIEPQNSAFVTGNNANGATVPQGPQYIPTVSHSAGANYFDRKSKLLYVTLRGRAVVDVVISPVVQLGLTLGMSVDAFYGSDLIKNLAALLGTTPDRIKVVDVVSETRGRRDAPSTTVVIQIADPPADTIVMPQTPAPQPNPEAPPADIVDNVPNAGNDTATGGSTNNGTSTDGGSGSGSGNGSTSGVGGVANSTTTLPDNTAAQMEAMNQLNSLAESFVALVQSNQLASGLGVEVLGAGVTLAAPPVAQNAPDTTGSGSDDGSGSGSGTGTGAVIQIPSSMALTSSSTGVVANGVFQGMFQLEVRDGSGALVNQLGILTPWNASVSIDTMANETAPGAQLSLGGTTLVYFSGGRANFTNVTLNVANTTQQVTVRLRFSTGNGQFAVVSAEIAVTYPVPRSSAAASATPTPSIASTTVVGQQPASSSPPPSASSVASSNAPTTTSAAASSIASSATAAATPSIANIMPPSPSSSSNTSMIAGVAIGGAVLVALCVGGYVWYARSHKAWAPKRVEAIQPETTADDKAKVADAPPSPAVSAWTPGKTAPVAMNTVMSSSAGQGFVPLPPVDPNEDAPLSTSLPSSDPLNVKQPIAESSPRYARAIAKLSYSPKFPDEVSLSVGDIVQVTDSSNASWYMGLNTATQKWGRIPKCCVESLQTPSPTPSTHSLNAELEGSHSSHPFAVPEVESLPPTLLGDVVPHAVDEPRPRTPTRRSPIPSPTRRSPVPGWEHAETPLQEELKSLPGFNISRRPSHEAPGYAGERRPSQEAPRDQHE